MAKRGYVVMSVSTFVPKPHTPFQWSGMLSLEEIQERQERIRKLVRSRRIRLKFHDPGQTVVEGWFARGDRRTAGMVEAAWRAGARFDGWMECFHLETWQAAREQAGVPVDHLYRDIPVQEPLPWDMVDVGIPRSYQEAEWAKAQSGATTPLCDTADACNGCRACSPAWLRERYRLREQMRDELKEMKPERTGEPADNDEQRLFYRFVFEKTGVARFISHLDLIHVLQRGIRMAALPVAFTRGFNPKPVLKFGPALELGVAGDRELFVGEFQQALPDNTVERLNGCLPAGIRIHAMTALDMSQRKELALDARLHYRVTFPKQPELLPRWRDLTILKKGKRGDRTIRIGDMVKRVEVRNREARIEILHTQQAGSLRVSEVVPLVFPDCDPAHAIMVRHQICYEMEGI